MLPLQTSHLPVYLYFLPARLHSGAQGKKGEHVLNRKLNYETER